MSTIMTRPAPLPRLADRAVDADYLAVTRKAYSIDGYDTVIVIIRVRETFVYLRTVCTAQGTIWREPTTEQRRRLVDEVIHPLGLVRSDRVDSTGWGHTYPVARVSTCHHEQCGYGDCSWLQAGGVVAGKPVCNEHLNHACRAGDWCVSRVVL